MEATNEAVGGGDPYNLERFVQAQEGDFEQALSEIRSGRKRSHWMWYIFPQFDGLGISSTSRRYSIKSVAEAKAYLAHPVLGPRLVECAEAALLVERLSAPRDLRLPRRHEAEILRDPVRSCVVRGFSVPPDTRQVLYGKPDEGRTLDRLQSLG